MNEPSSRPRGTRLRRIARGARLLALWAALSSLVAWAAPLGAQAPPEVSTPLALEAPEIVLSGVPFELRVSGLGTPANAAIPYRISIEGSEASLLEGELEPSPAQPSGTRRIDLTIDEISGAQTLRLHVHGVEAQASLRVIPGWLSILPPLLAIVLALLLRQVLIALLSGIWLGALFVVGFHPFEALLRTADRYAVGAIADRDHASILVFSLLLGGMIGIITRSGGGLGLAQLVTKMAKDSRRGQLAAWMMGLVIFFDDYANSLLVGSSMRPISDRLRISREKLAFLVDATSAPVASIALFSSWIGVEIGYIADQLGALGIEEDPYLLFLETIPYRFYPLLMLFFGLLLILSRRDFGPMARAERRAREEGKLVADGSNPASDFEDEVQAMAAEPRWVNAALPVGVVVLTAMLGMLIDGLAKTDVSEPALRDIFSAASSLDALLWASLLGSLSAFVLTRSNGSLSTEGAMNAWLSGVRSMLLAAMILVLAWSLGSICRELHTASFVIQAIGGWLSAGLLSSVVFVVAALVSFATGTSWGTMAILFPLVIPMAHELAPGEHHILIGGVAAILAGSVWGDHCSPISDTTIMSSMASSCDHVDHVRTQLPYALSVGLVSLILGELGTGFDLYPGWVGLLLGMVALTALVFGIGVKIPEHRPSLESESR